MTTWGRLGRFSESPMAHMCPVGYHIQTRLMRERPAGSSVILPQCTNHGSRKPWKCSRTPSGWLQDAPGSLREPPGHLQDASRMLQDAPGRLQDPESSWRASVRKFPAPAAVCRADRGRDPGGTRPGPGRDPGGTQAGPGRDPGGTRREPGPTGEPN